MKTLARPMRATRFSGLWASQPEKTYSWPGSVRNVCSSVAAPGVPTRSRLWRPCPGAAAGSRKWMDRVRHMVIYLGGSMDPGAAFLLIRGMKTMGVRVAQQCANAMTVANFLERHPKVARVHYPGLKSHPDHALAKKQMKGFGSMLAFDLQGGLPAARRFCDRVQLFLLAASLGGVESLVVLPVYSSHYRMSKQELEAAGVTPGTVRVSVGLEDAEDLIADLKQALS